MTCTAIDVFIIESRGWRTCIYIYIYIVKITYSRLVVAASTAIGHRLEGFRRHDNYGGGKVLFFFFPPPTIHFRRYSSFFFSFPPPNPSQHRSVPGNPNTPRRRRPASRRPRRPVIAVISKKLFVLLFLGRAIKYKNDTETVAAEDFILAGSTQWQYNNLQHG